jgi:hypothetical protein
MRIFFLYGTYFSNVRIYTRGHFKLLKLGQFEPHNILLKHLLCQAPSMIKFIYSQLFGYYMHCTAAAYTIEKNI